MSTTVLSQPKVFPLFITGQKVELSYAHPTTDLNQELPHQPPLLPAPHTAVFLGASPLTVYLTDNTRRLRELPILTLPDTAYDHAQSVSWLTYQDGHTLRVTMTITC